MAVEKRVVMIGSFHQWLRMDTRIGSDTKGGSARRHFYLRWSHSGNRRPEIRPARYGYKCILCCASDTGRTTRQASQGKRKDQAMAQRAKRIAEENSHHDCDFRDMLSRVGDKWSLLVIFILKGRPAFRGRFSDLKRSIPGISQRMRTVAVSIRWDIPGMLRFRSENRPRNAGLPLRMKITSRLHLSPTRLSMSRKSQSWWLFSSAILFARCAIA